MAAEKLRVKSHDRIGLEASLLLRLPSSIFTFSGYMVNKEKREEEIMKEKSEAKPERGSEGSNENQV